ncbi:lysM domain receptor-like kinase 3 [Corylus avellana]|uniref:lysM domain receptor-like kinase 3 n=1 Tax=Corylus avellana TaxID=13451 RepID=UPI001E209B6C|nr:lysM domain receptor-like kinase 3 [Corylus avellana]
MIRPHRPAHFSSHHSIPDGTTNSLAIPMCKTKKSTDAIEPKRADAEPRKSFNSSFSSLPDPSANNFTSTANFPNTGSSNNYKNYSSKSSASSRASLSSLKDSLPENTHVYDFSEIRAATNNFLAKKFSSSSSSAGWRCTVRSKEVIVFQRKLRRPMELPELQGRVLTIGRSHHSSLVKLLGASMSGNYIYLVYEFVDGANLSECLRNPRNPSFTVLSTWLSRMQVATDLAHGLEYIHHCTGLSSGFVHNHIKSSSIIVTGGSLNAKICHFGTAELCGEIVENHSSDSAKLKRSDSRGIKLEGTRGYMAPEFQSTGIASQKSDVYAFGVVVLELLSGEEALKYSFDEEGGGYRRVSVIDTARETVVEGGGDGMVRRWVDRRLKDSYPVDVAEKMVRLGLDCVEEDPDKRPDMSRVALWVSKLYMESQKWAERIGMPTDFSVSMAPR